MALINCKGCGTEISTEAKSCPKCGRQQERRSVLRRIAPYVFMGGGVFIVIAVIGVSLEERSRSAAQQAMLAAMTSEQRAAYQAEVAEKKAVGAVRFACQEFIKRKLIDPKSAEFDDPGYGIGITHEAGLYHVLERVRARNASNAVRVVTFKCDVKDDGDKWIAQTVKEID